ncbi:MAG: type II secretion system F family protein [Candidatus Komeilibacteria bacterium]|nr:type II secretion system F family protein [Candidatus Komeilibacteria bacterium]MBT4447585.1 type II secretion system F family protein [Candidatus Komeilibacteria bacterium]
MLFSYKLSDNKDKITKGTIEASNRKQARNQLVLKDGVLISLEPVGRAKRHKSGKGQILLGRIKLLEKVMFAKHLSVMIKAGMSIDGSLETLKENASPLMARALSQVLVDVRKGNPLSSALKKYPKDFDLLFVNMVAAGEKGGNLAKNLELLSIQQQKSYELRAKLKAASMYPTIILLAVVALTAVVSKFVLPKIVGFFTSLNVELPLSTRILIGSADFLSHYWLWLVLGVISLMTVWNTMLRFPNTRLILHKFILRLPIIGKLVSDMNLALFCRTLSSLLGSGITIDQALQIVSQTMTSEVYKREIINIYQKVLKGTALSDSINNKKYFPSIIPRMINVGEESGNLSEVLDYLADFYELEVDNTTKNLSTMLEPILLVGIGLVVGFVAMSIINPIYDLTSKISP